MQLGSHPPMVDLWKANDGTPIGVGHLVGLFGDRTMTVLGADPQGRPVVCDQDGRRAVIDPGEMLLRVDDPDVLAHRYFDPSGGRESMSEFTFADTTGTSSEPETAAAEDITAATEPSEPVKV